jgi:hypothetical protein
MRNLIKKILKENEWGWVDEISSNPFALDLSVVFFDKKLTKKEAEYIMDLIDVAGVYYEQSREIVVDSLVAYSPGGYIKSYISNKNIKRFGYGDNKRLFEDYKWKSVLDSLEGKQYVEFNVTDVLPKTNITESDEWDWVRDTTPWISFEDAQIGDIYNIETDEVLLNALNACGDYEGMYYDSVSAEVINKDYSLKYSSVYCGSENHDKVISLMLEFIDEHGIAIGNFWVTEDMVTLYPKI